MTGGEAGGPGLDAATREGIVAHMNDDHSDAVLLYARVFGGLPAAHAAVMADIDANGMTLLVRLPDGDRTIDVRFDEPVTCAGRARDVLVRMARIAREKAE